MLIYIIVLSAKIQSTSLLTGHHTKTKSKQKPCRSYYNKIVTFSSLGTLRVVSVSNNCKYKLRAVQMLSNRPTQENTPI